MSKIRDAAQKALEALEQHGCPWIRHEKPYNEAITAIREAQAEPVLAPAPGYCKHCKQYTIEEPLPAEPQRSGSEHMEPVLGTKTWFEDGKVVTQNLTAADIYKAEQQEPDAALRIAIDAARSKT